MAEIQNFARRIAEEFHPERIILFGSYAYGQPTPDSDVDILVALPYQGRPWRVATEIRNRIDVAFALDLLVRSPAEMAERIGLGDCFLREVVEKGVVLYEQPHR